MSISSRIEAIEGHIGDIYDTLELGGSDLTNVDKNIVNINSELLGRYKDYLANGTDELWNNWDKATETGVNEAIINNTIKGKMAITPKGDTEQATRSGKNLCKITGTPISSKINFDNNQINITGTFSSNQWQPFTKIALPAGTYTFSFSASFPITMNTYFLINGSSTAGVSKYTFTLNEDTEISFSLVLSAGTYDNDYIRCQLEQGSTATPYEEYGASPSPDYSSVIKNVKGKNIFNKNAETVYNSYASKIVLDTGVRITDTGSSSGNHYSHILLGDLRGHEGQVLRVKCKSTASSTNAPMIILRNSNSPTQVGSALLYLNNDEIIYTIPNDISANPYYGLSIYSNYGSNWSSGCYVDYTNLIVTINNSDMSYLPYNTVQIKVQNKNLFDKNNPNVLNAYFVSDDNTLISNSVHRCIYIPCKPNTTYTVQKSSGGERFRVGFSDNIPVIGSVLSNTETTTNGDNLTEITATSGANSKYLVAWIYFTALATLTFDEILDTIQIEESSVKTPYVAHQEQIVNFPLSEGQVLHKGDYLADDGVHSSWGDIDFIGSVTENWNLQSITSGKNYYIYISNAKANSNKLYNNLGKFKTFSSVDTNVPNGSSYISMSKNLNFLCNNVLTVAELKTFLASKNMHIQYELAEPTVTQYTSEQQTAWEQIKALYSYNEQTNISQDGDLPFKLDITALVELS